MGRLYVGYVPVECCRGWGLLMGQTAANTKPPTNTLSLPPPPPWPNHNHNH
jgi:hypothetical protein